MATTKEKGLEQGLTDGAGNYIPFNENGEVPESEKQRTKGWSHYTKDADGNYKVTGGKKSHDDDDPKSHAKKK